jgi:hypothetical protein
MFKFHVPVKTEKAVAVACSDLLACVELTITCVTQSDTRQQSRHPSSRHEA